MIFLIEDKYWVRNLKLKEKTSTFGKQFLRLCPQVVLPKPVIGVPFIHKT